MSAMRRALAILGWVAALMGTASGFFVAGPLKIVSEGSTRSSASQAIKMGRGDTRTVKGKRKRHTYGKCRPQKKNILAGGEAGVAKPAPTARRWENIEYVESEMAPLKRAIKQASMEEAGENATMPAELEAGAVAVAAPPAEVPVEEVTTMPQAEAETVAPPEVEEALLGEAPAGTAAETEQEAGGEPVGSSPDP